MMTGSPPREACLEDFQVASHKYTFRDVFYFQHEYMAFDSNRNDVI